MPGETAGVAYGSIISEQLLEERARKASLEQRALSVITTSGTLVTLLFALTGLVTAAEFTLPDGARCLLGLSLVAFVVASGLSIAVNWPVDYSEPKLADLRGLLTDQEWNVDATAGELAVATARLDTLEKAREKNGNKARLLVAAMGAEVAAVLLLACAIAVVLWSTGG